jgi:hypothetical protein
MLESNATSFSSALEVTKNTFLASSDNKIKDQSHFNINEYIARFKHNPIGSIKSDRFFAFYIHYAKNESRKVEASHSQFTVQDEDHCIDVVNCYCDVMVFEYAKGIRKFKVKSDKVRSKEEVIDLINCFDLSGKSNIEFRDRFTPKHLSILNSSFLLYALLDEMDPSKKRRFQYGKANGMFIQYRIALKEFVANLPSEIVKIMNRHLCFHYQIFNFLYASGDFSKQRQRADAINAFPFVFFGSFDIFGRNYQEMIEHLDNDRPLIEHLHLKHKVNYSLLRKIHGISVQKMHVNKFLHLSFEVVIDRLSTIESLIPKKPNKKFFIDAQAILKPIYDFKRLFDGQMSYIDKPKADQWKASCIKFVFEKLNGAEGLAEMEQITSDIQGISDYLRFLKQTFMLNDSKMGEVTKKLSIGNVFDLSAKWHENIDRVQDIKRDAVFSVGQNGSSRPVFSVPHLISDQVFLEEDLYIVPLLTQKELESEGRSMKHCVSGYYREITQYGSYIFSLRKKGMRVPIATIEISQSLSNEINLNIVQIKGKKNTSIDKQYQSTFVRWFEKNLKTLKKAAKSNVKKIGSNIEVQEICDLSSFANQTLIAQTTLDIMRKTLPIVLPRILKE